MPLHSHPSTPCNAFCGRDVHSLQQLTSMKAADRMDSINGDGKARSRTANWTDRRTYNTYTWTNRGKQTHSANKHDTQRIRVMPAWPLFGYPCNDTMESRCNRTQGNAHTHTHTHAHTHTRAHAHATHTRAQTAVH